MGSLLEHLPPFHVGLSNDILQQVLRPEDSPNAVRQRKERIVTHRDMAEQNASQHTRGVSQMAAQVILDGQFSFTVLARRRRALAPSATSHLHAPSAHT